VNTLADGRQKLWAGEYTFECDRLLVPLAPVTVQHQALQLDAANVVWREDTILRNWKCQTSNPRIYVCYERGDIAGILQHVLFWNLPVLGGR
jgi:hypothetical protein